MHYFSRKVADVCSRRRKKRDERERETKRERESERQRERGVGSEREFFFNFNLNNYVFFYKLLQISQGASFHLAVNINNIIIN